MAAARRTRARAAQSPMRNRYASEAHQRSEMDCTPHPVAEVKAVSVGDESTRLGESQPQAHVGCVVNDLALS